MSTPSRLAAARALHAVLGEGRRVREDWDAGLTPEDAGLAQALLGLALRRWGRLQAWAEGRLKDPGRGLPLGSRVALACGLAQLAWLEGVSTHAAVNESVELVADRHLGFPPHRGLVNALLRRASADREGLRRELEALPAALDRTPFAEAALRAALAPRGQEAALEQLWARLQQPPEASYRALKPGPLPEGLEPHPLQPGALRLAAGASFPRAWLVQGAGMVQDLSSQALMAFAWEARPRRILDACAAPGGKTAALARRWPEAELFALEAHAARAKRLEENLRQRGVRAHVVQEEAAAWMRQGGRPFDLILLDAPCSGSGTLQKHPELTWIRDGLDVERLASIQRGLLEAAAARLAPGGLLVYAVCSWLPEEGEAHRSALLAAHPELRPVPAWPSAFGLGASPSPVFRPDPLAWPGEGFQAFALTRAPETSA